MAPSRAMPPMPAASAYRTNAAEKRLTRSLVFDQLPMAVQDRLTRSLAEGGAPRPLLSVVRGTRPPSARRWAYVAVAALCADLAAWVIGYGDRLNEPVLSPAGLSLLHAVALSVGVFAALRAARIRRRYLGISYPTGRHLFDLDLVEVDGREIHVTALDTLKSVEPRDVPGSQEQVGWSAMTKAIDHMTVQVTEDPYDPDKTRKRSQDEAYRRMLDSLDTVIRVEMGRRL